MKARLLWITLKLFAATSALSADKIEGAFGKKLGDQFDPSTAIGTGKLTDGTPMYRFSPTNEFRAFTDYFVLITPKTHRIWCIWAQGSTENTDTGKKEQDLVMLILKDKYGEPKKQRAIDRLGDVKVIDQGNRCITTKLTGIAKVTFDVRYMDLLHSEQADKEHLQEEARKVDKSGL